MKKLLNLALATGMGLTTVMGGLTVFAADLGEREVSMESNSHSLNADIEARGFIGLYPGEEDEDVPTLPLPDEFISVVVPEDVNWYVTSATGGQVESADFRIINNSRNANLEVTLESFILSEEFLRSDLDGLNLNLILNGSSVRGSNNTDDGIEVPINLLNAQNVRLGIISSKAALATDDEEQALEELEQGEVWTFNFGGTFTGTIPALALQPTFDMVLAFNVYSYTTTPEITE